MHSAAMSSSRDCFPGPNRPLADLGRLSKVALLLASITLQACNIGKPQPDAPAPQAPSTLQTHTPSQDVAPSAKNSVTAETDTTSISAEDVSELKNHKHEPIHTLPSTQNSTSSPATTDAPLAAQAPTSSSKQAIKANTDSEDTKPLSNEPNQKPKIAIVIDDLGYQLAPALALAKMPYPLTLAVIPGSPYAHKAANIIDQHRQELILHVPMQTLNTEKWEDGLNVNMDEEAFNQKLEGMLMDFPAIKGINNHGGSLLTADQERMDWVMQILAEHQLFFLDSRTTSDSVAILSTENYGVAHSSRDVFLDNERDPKSIAREFKRLREIALKHGHAIAIGHPYPSTLAQLNTQLPLLLEEGFQISFCSDLLTHPKMQKVARKTPPPSQSVKKISKK